MNERRMSLGNRILSLVLALVMVFGMLPSGIFAFRAKAADSTTQTNVTNIRNYAKSLLSDTNFTYAGTATGNDKKYLSWDTEGKSDDWRYYNGLMVDALLMLGSDAVSDDAAYRDAFEFASVFYDANVTDSGYLERFSDNEIDNDELDSIQPARALFDLLGTAADKDEYEKVLHFMYSEMMGYTQYTGSNGIFNAGGNFLHKTTNAWKYWNIGLDGLYMGQPFLMEYANAIDEGKLSNQKNVTTSTIYNDVYRRMHWVADNMTTEDANGNVLYLHGFSTVDNTKSDIVWARGVGWYVAALVDVIEMMPAGSNRTQLIADLKELLDGMLAYQDKASGMWYNVVYDDYNKKAGMEIEPGTKSTTDDFEQCENDLETSGTALMAYALMKAYNNGWVTDPIYGEKGLAAFNGIFAKGYASSTAVKNIYKSAGVGDYQNKTYNSSEKKFDSAANNVHDEYFNKKEWTNAGEAKGVGPLLMAASLALDTESKLAGGSGVDETFAIGGIYAPAGLTVPVGGTAADIDYSEIIVTVVGSEGTIKNLTVSTGASFVITGDTSAAGTAEVIAYYGENNPIGTFNVQVIAPNAAITANGTIGGANNVKYKKATGTLSANVPYVLTQNDTGDEKRVAYVDASSKTITAQTATISSSSGYGVFSSFSPNEQPTYWYLDNSGNIYTILGTKTYYLELNGKSSTAIALVESASDNTKFKVSGTGSYTFQGTGDYNRYLSLESGGLQNKGSAGSFYVYEVESSGNKVILSVEPNTVNLNAGATQALTTKVTVDGTEVDLSACTIEWTTSKDSVASVSGGTITAVSEGTATITATLSKAPVDGTSTSLDKSISVQITVNVTGVACEHTYGEGVVTAPTCTENGYTTYTCSVCGDTYTGNETAALGHSWGTGVETTAPTCTTAGVKTYTCSTCSETKTETIAALGHDWNDGVVTTEPTCGAAGEKTFTCQNDTTHTKTEPVAATGEHTYVNGECTVCGAVQSTDKYVIPTQMENNKQYLLNNSQKPARAAYWDGDSWETGTVSVTNSGDIYTITPSTGYTLLTWESKDNSTTQGYFSFMNGDSKVYISGVDSVTSSKSNAAVFTVDLTNKTVKLGSDYIKIEEKSGIKLYDDAQKSMRLFTPSTSGGTTPDPDEPDTPPVTGSQYVHDFTANGKNSDFYTISGNLATGKGTVDYDGKTLTQALKMESSTNISFTAPADGKLTLVFVEETPNIKIDGKKVTGSKGIITIDLTAGSHTITKADTMNLFYMVYTPEGDSLSISGQQHLQIGGTDRTELTFAVRYDGQNLTDGYELLVESSNTDAVQIEQEDGKFYAVAKDGGVATITAKLVKVGQTDVSGKNIQATLDVDVAEPTITVDEEKTVYLDDRAVTIYPYVAYGENAVTKFTVTASTPDGTKVTATANDDGSVTLVGLSATAEGETVDVTITLTSVNGNTIPEGLTYSDITKVEVVPVKITKMTLVPNVITRSTEDTLADVTSDENQIQLVIDFNNGDVQIVDAERLKFDNSAIKESDGKLVEGNYTVPVSFDDETLGVEYRNSITVAVLSADLIGAEGIASDVKVEYELDTDGTIQGGDKYIIVVNGKALMVAEGANDDNTGALNGNLTVSQDGKIITVSALADHTEFLFSGRKTSNSNQTYSQVYATANGKNFSLYNNSSNVLDTGSNSTITLFAVDEDAGEYKIGLRSDDYYLVLNDSSWGRTSDATKATVVKLYKRTETATNSKTVGFEIRGDNVGACENNVHAVINPVGVGLSMDVIPSVTLGGQKIEDLSGCVIEWSVEENGKDYIKVENGKITGLKVTDKAYKVYARLVSVDGKKIIENESNNAYLQEIIEVTVQQDTLRYDIFIDGVQKETMKLPLGVKPDLNRVEVRVYSQLNAAYVETYQYSDLIFKVADSTLDVNKPNSSATIEIQNKSTETKIGDLKVEVGASVTDNRDTATEFPGYPDEGAVRFNKFATGIDFLQTAIAKIELNVAGISTNAPVDVILIVDVSNSMGWSILKSSNSDDHLQIPDKVEGSDDLYKDDKLDNAMDSATTFADILLRNNMAGDKENNNTITFVTFAGNDINKPGAKTGSVDATQTVFVGVDNFTDAQKSFDNTEFTNYRVYTETDKNDKEVTKVEYSLKISGINGQPTVQTINGTQYTSSGKNEGGTNYDYGFLEAQAAARALKNEVAGSEEDYDKSNRKLVVVFMTDGAASHYNGWCNGTSSQIDGFTKRGTNDDPWIDMLKKPSNNATALYAMVSEMYTIGFDLKNGGLADEATAKRILSGLVENQKLDCKLAENDTELQAFFEDLANSLAFAGTAANVADVVSTDFVLWTDPVTYGEGANQKTITPDIQVVSRRLVVRGDVGTTLHVAEKQGEAGVKVTLSATNIESYLGYYVLGTYESADAAEYTSVEVEILETVTFASGEVAYSSVKGVSDNIWEGGKITASNFVYDVDKKTFSWTIGNISDREVALVYYGYLTGTYNRLGNDGTAREDGQYPTNKEASLSYIDVNGDLATRMYPVPHMTWGEAAVTVRFYLVDADGKFINRAGHTFDSPANRIFLENRAYYDYPLGDAKTVNAAQALQEAKFVESYTLYDPDANITVSNKDKTIAWTHSENVQKQLEYYIDNSGGNFTNVIIDIPVIMTDLGESDQKMSDSIVVIDYSNSVQWDVRGDAEKQYDGVEFGGVKYSIELVGFATYNPNVDLKDYIFETTWATTIDATYGTFSIGEGEDQVIYTPNKMLGGADHVFAVFKFENLQAGQTETEDFYYMYKHIIVVPATVVHYETTGNMGGAFTSTDKDEKAWSVAESKDDGNAVVGAVTKYQSSANSGYGYDESYTGCIAFSGGSALSIENTDRTATKPSVKFTFTGTGIDIIGATNPDQGLIRMTITAKGAEDPVKTVVVLNKGVDTLYQIPVLSVEGLPYDTYEAEIIVYAKTTTYGGTFYFDAINVYGSAREADVVGSNTAGNITVESLYKAAGEYAPQIVEIRDILLGNNSFGNVTASGVNGAAVYIDGGSTLGEGSTNFNDYDKIGPNNEVYLSQNQAIAFKIKATDGNLPKTLAIGLKALNAEADVSIIVVDANNKQYNYSYTVATSTAMFYDLLGGDKLTDFTTGANGLTIVIANKDTDKVTFSVTDLKVGYGDNKGKITTVVDSDIADQATAALKASADVVSVTCNGNAYAMYTTTLEVVTGQAATSIQVTDGNQTIDATATFVDTIDGYRQWRVLIRLPEVGDKTLTVTGLDSNGAASTVTGNIELQVALFEGATKTTD